MKKLFLPLLMLAFIVTVHAQDSTLQEYTGKYKFPDGSVVTEIDLTIENGILTSNSTAGTSTLEKLGTDSFSVVSFQGVAIFKRDDNKKIAKVVIDAMGYHLEGAKDPAAAVSFRRTEAVKNKLPQLSK
jgi:hypothetical protein